MKISKAIILPALVYLFVACSADKQPDENLSETMNAADPHSFARPDEAVITHLDWVAQVNFEQKIIEATASFTIKASAGAREIILDDNNLNIFSVVDQDGNTLPYNIGVAQPFLGSPLYIDIHESTQIIKISYRTDPSAEALQWLTAKQTATEIMPFLFTQSEAILCRTWIPIQDSPGIRFTYSASVNVPKGMLALMSAENPTQISADGNYKFEMNQPIPAYLMALAVGDIRYQKVGERTGVYAEPSVIKPAAWEFADMEDMVKAAESLYGPYRWQVYDLIVLPPSFPFGGMENPRITFATPTILAGDKSLTSLVAHELAHSWSGNLVTNATWNDFWINEGFTVYFEERIMEAVFGRDYSEMLAVLNMQDLQSKIAELESENRSADTWLKLDLAGRNPDDGVTDIAYNKGYFFLRLLEEKVGRPTFDAFLKEYFKSNAFKSMSTEKLIEYLNTNLFKKNNIAIDQRLYEQWIYGPGLPENHPTPHSDRFKKVDEVVSAWVEGKPIGMLIPQEDLLTQKWSSHEWLHFIRSLPADMSLVQMKALDDYLQFTYSGNSEILAAWMIHVIKHEYTPGYQNLENFLVSVGRRKFLVPLYSEMAKTEEGMEMAREIYGKARDNYHYVAVSSIDQILNWSPILL